MAEELLIGEEEIYLDDLASVKDINSDIRKIVSSPKIVKNSTNEAYHKILRYIIIGTIVSVTFFLLTYSAYLVAIQYLLNVANKYNSKLFVDNKIFFEIDVIGYNFNTSCSFKSHSIVCIMHNIKRLKNSGVTDLIITNIFNQNYQLRPEFGDEELFKKLLQKMEKYQMSIYLDIERKPKEWINTVGYTGGVAAVNNSCIDMYCDDVLAVIHKYAAMGVDGFVINDIPCCAMFPQYFNTKPQNCSFSAFREFRKIARKEGKPSGLIYRPKHEIYDSLMEKLSNYDCSYLDAIIKYVDVDSDGVIQIPTAPNLKPTIFAHTIWTTKIITSNISKVTENFLLYQSAAAFFTGSFLFIGDSKTRTSNTNDERDNILEGYNKDIELLHFVSTFKDLLLNVSCVSNYSIFIHQHYGDDIFVAVQEMINEQSRYCAIAINLSGEVAKINTRTQINETTIGTRKTWSLLNIESEKVEKLEVLYPKTTITLKPKSAKVFKL